MFPFFSFLFLALSVFLTQSFSAWRAYFAWHYWGHVCLQGKTESEIQIGGHRRHLLDAQFQPCHSVSCVVTQDLVGMLSISPAAADPNLKWRSSPCWSSNLIILFVNYRAIDDYHFLNEINRIKVLYCVGMIKKGRTRQEVCPKCLFCAWLSRWHP